ncbi:predicted protein [Postia placenta Mad-698-R]|uniref:Uncharacterized protein n=1 Tax=Postia placenta MAD-698-R-SB12 TaxID=670580 RepID=A0A1X6MZ27_9APHY|nr:hypothetical protein POSPLADRAFT_1145018 [Postia placenta MAD-698-R-SB12]EED83396.1 predicted protein [Postia placenta Mad-698-R]OSX61492.1 hypothetical protein POSPLADRAFT_1145018 [Postia placenta MAD-698-R-SB12]
MCGSSINEDKNVQLVEYTLIENYIEVMAMSLFVYDSIISFDLEWRTVWSPHSFSGVLSVLNVSCFRSLNYIGFQLLHPIFTGRMHCLRDIFGSGSILALKQSYIVLQKFGLLSLHSRLPNTTMLLATRTCVLMSNLLVVVSTWQATRANRAATMRNSKGSLTTTLIRDGIVHFALVVGINIADITSALLTGHWILSGKFLLEVTHEGTAVGKLYDTSECQTTTNVA